MQKISLPTSTIYIGTHVLETISDLVNLDSYSTVFVVTDQNTASHWLPKLTGLPGGTKSLVLQSGESTKHIDTVQKIWLAMHEAGCDRKSLVINLGGGVVCDMGGFAASTYMRGVDFVNIPTTLLAQVDASIGGKTGIDLRGLKNLVGTFTDPKVVIIDTQTLVTLPDREFVAGFGELLKHGLIMDKDFYATVTSKKPRDFSDDELADIIYNSCKIKARGIENDQKESGKRKLLNHGHTIGHAIESCSFETDHPLLHGEAVSIGMMAEAKLSELKGMIKVADVERIRSDLGHAGLPVSFPDLDTQKLLGLMKSDKKNTSGVINFTLLKSIGNAVYDQTATEEEITQALAYVTKGTA